MRLSLLAAFGLPLSPPGPLTLHSNSVAAVAALLLHPALPFLLPSTSSTSQTRQFSRARWVLQHFKPLSKLHQDTSTRGQVIWDGKPPQPVGRSNIADQAGKFKGNQTSNLGGNQGAGDGKDDKDKKVGPVIRGFPKDSSRFQFLWSLEQC